MNKDFLFYSNLSVEKVFDDLQTTSCGLTEQEAKKRFITYGPNRLQRTNVTALTIFFNQVKNPFIFMFVCVAILYFFTQQYTESIIIIMIMIINTAIGFYQEYHSNKAMELLQAYLEASILVRRNGTDQKVEVSTIVPGDIIVLKAGDIVPADCRIIDSNNLMIDEASLSGESIPIHKMHELPQETITELWKTTTSAFAGTVVTDGSGIGVVFATGVHSQLGSISALATHTIIKSNLAQNSMQLARFVLILILISLAVIIFINLFIKTDHISFINILFFAAALSITAIPSALPIVITFCLTRGAMALHKHKIIVKRLSAIEDLGGINVFCADKTGTLTENNLKVKDVYNSDNYDSLIFAALSADTTITSNSFDAAIVQKLTPEQSKEIAQYTVIKTLPFTYERHRTITFAQKNNTHFFITKGSFEYVVEHCVPLQSDELEKLKAWMSDNETKSNRVIAVAIKEVPEKKVKTEFINDDDIKYDSIGLIAFVDPLNSTALTAIKKAQALDVQIKILSGDSRDVCFFIAQQLGLENNHDNVVLGSDFEKANEQEKTELVNGRTIFARVNPQQKYEIISLLQRTYSVGYIGDGINDAPALKIAQVGIAVKDAARVAQEAAEIILLQKSLLNIMLGVEEGRKIIINTLKYIKVTIACNVGHFYSLALSSLWLNYLPMLPLQLLFLDLITDFPLIGISSDSVTYQELKRPLRYSLKDIGLVVLLFGVVISFFDFIIFMFFKSDPATLQTSWFIAAALGQLVFIFSLRTTLPFCKAHRPSMLLLSLCSMAAGIIIVLPFTMLGQNIFLFKHPTAYTMFMILSITTVYFVATEIVKLLYYRCLFGKRSYSDTKK